MNISGLILRCSIAVLGRWARYQLTQTCQLPTAVVGADHPRIVRSWASDSFTLFRASRAGGIFWPGVPNHAMSPQNRAARCIYAAFIRGAGADDPSRSWKDPLDEFYAADTKRRLAAAHHGVSLYDVDTSEIRTRH